MSRRRTPEEILEREQTRLRLLQARVQIEQTKAMLATYKAAERTRFTADWRAPRRSADGATIPDLPTLHGRARQLVRDDAYAASAVRAFRRNVVGTGVVAFARRKLPDGTPDRGWNGTLDPLWRRWERDPRQVDVQRRRNLMMFGWWAMNELVVAGEALILKCLAMRAGRPRLCLQAVEAEQLDEEIQEHEGREVRGGVELDQAGAPIAYHFRRRPPGDLGREAPTVRITADRVAHVMDPDRAHQTRAASRLAPCMLRLRHLGEHDSSHLIAARAESNIGLVIEREDPTAPLNPAGTDAAEKDTLDFSPLAIMRLRRGEKATSFTPQRAAQVYAPFTEAQLRAAAASIGISYEQLARDFSRGTYSSQRQAMLEDRREYAMLHELLVALMYQPIREWFIHECVLDGQLLAPGYSRDPEAWHETMWLPDGWQWIDPQKESAADTTAFAQDFDTHQSIVGRRTGELSEDVMRENARTRAQRRKMVIQAYAAEGLPPPPEDGAGSASSPAKAAVAINDEADEAATDAAAGAGLNGAQVTALLAVVEQVRTSAISADAAKQIVAQAFPMIDEDAVDRIFSAMEQAPGAPTVQEAAT